MERTADEQSVAARPDIDDGGVRRAPLNAERRVRVAEGKFRSAGGPFREAEGPLREGERRFRDAEARVASLILGFSTMGVLSRDRTGIFVLQDSVSRIRASAHVARNAELELEIPFRRGNVAPFDASDQFLKIRESVRGSRSRDASARERSELRGAGLAVWNLGTLGSRFRCSDRGIASSESILGFSRLRFDPLASVVALAVHEVGSFDSGSDVLRAERRSSPRD
jgi:hypothetical protein